MSNAIATGDRVIITKGCRSLGLDKRVTLRVAEVRELGAEYSHSVRVTLEPLSGAKAGRGMISLSARHANRLRDDVVRLSSVDPTKFIEVRRTSFQPGARMA